MGAKFVIISDNERDMSGVRDSLCLKIPDCLVAESADISAVTADTTCVFIGVENGKFEEISSAMSARHPEIPAYAVIFSDTPYKKASKVIASDAYKYMEYPGEF